MPPHIRRRLWFPLLAFPVLLFAASGRAQKTAATDVLTISMDEVATVLELEAPGFVSQRNESKEDGSQDFYAVNKDTGINLGILLKLSPAPLTREGCHDSLMRSAPGPSSPGRAAPDLHFTEIEGLTAVEYTVPAGKDAPSEEKSVVACLARGKIFALIHLSKAGFQPADQKLFAQILKTVRFSGPAATDEPVPAPPPPASHAAEDSPVVRGAALFKTYKCFECHGSRGEGTDDAPDLIGTRLDAEAIALFLQKPSSHARSVGMPNLPADSPDLQPLVAFVLSLKRGEAAQ